MVYSPPRTPMWNLTQNEPVLSPAAAAVPGRLERRGASLESENTREAFTAHVQHEVAALYGERAPELLSYGLLLSRDKELARDGLQEVFMRYFVARCGGETIASPRAWLYRVLHNYLLDRLQESRARLDQSLDQSSAPVDNRQDVEAAFFRTEVLEMARGALTPREFDCFVLRSHGLPYEEIADELNLRSGTVGALLSRSIRKVRRLVLRPTGGSA